MYYIYLITIFLATKHVESYYDILRRTTREHIYSSGQVQLYMVREQIVPEIIDVPPRRRCQVSFPNVEQLRPGEKLFPNMTDKQPHLFWRGRNDTLYTIYMIGWRKEIKYKVRMRAYWPKRLKKYILHGRTGTTTRKVKIIDDWDQWLVVNVPNNHVRYGDTIHKYVPPPPAQDGIVPPRYIFVIFQQKSRLNVTHIKESKVVRIPSISRIMNFALEHDLGEPLAGNYFVSRRTHRFTGKKTSLNKQTRKVYTPPSIIPTHMGELIKILDKRKQFKIVED